MGNYRTPFLPGQVYHLYNHGNGEDDIFRNTDNYIYFLKKYAQYLNPVVETFAYCLMPNHFHFLIQIRHTDALFLFFQTQKRDKLLEKMSPEKRAGWENHLTIELDTEDLPKLVSQQFSHFLNGYTQAFNKLYKRKGSLFLDNIQRKIVEDEKYFTTLIHYIHSNPVHHGFVRSIDDWHYSSYASLMDIRKTHLQRQKVLDWFGGLDDYKTVHAHPPKPFSLALDFD